MSEQKIIAIGDIHGCVKSLKALLRKLKTFSDATFVFLGDYVDRGPDSKGVVDVLLDFSKKHECVFLRGNHEQMFMEAIYHGDMEGWFLNGGHSTYSSYSSALGRMKIPDEHEIFYRKTRFFYDTPEYLFVHAGLKADQTIQESLDDPNNYESFLWERSHLYTRDNVWEKTVVFGHTPEPIPYVGENMLGIDTGCVYKSRDGLGTLTAVLLPDMEFIQQKCKD